MKGLLRFLVFATLGLGLIWVITSGEGLFPFFDQPEAEPSEPPPRHRPVAEFQQGAGAITLAARGSIGIFSSRRIRHSDGSLEERPRYRIEAKDSQPTELGNYTLSDALITFFEDAPRPSPMALLRARNLTIGLVTGTSGLQAKEDQEMLLTGAEIATGPAFTGGSFRLRTDRMLVLMGPESILLKTPLEEIPFRVEGEAGGGTIELRGRGLTARLPPLAERDTPHASTAPNAVSTEMNFLGASDHEGSWRREQEEILFSCRGPLEFSRSGHDAPPSLSLEQDVRVRRQGPGGRSFLRGDRLHATLRPGPLEQRGSGLGLSLEVLHLVGRPAILGDPRGELRAQNLTAEFDALGEFRALLAQGNPFFKGSAGENRQAEARCAGSLKIARISSEPFVPFPIPGLVIELLSRSLPGYQLLLSGASTLDLDDPTSPARVEAENGIDLLFSKDLELLALNGFGKCDLASAEFKATSQDGFTRINSPWFSLFPYSLTHLGPPERPRPVRFSLLDRSAPDGPAFKIEGLGLLDLQSRPDGEEIVEVRRAGPRGFLRVQTSAGGESVLLEEAQKLVLTRTGPGRPRLRAESDWFLPFRLTLPSRGMTAWAWELVAFEEELKLFGTADQPVLLTSKDETLSEATERTPGRLRMLAPEVRFQADRFRLRALGGVRLHLAGMGLIPGASITESKFWANELEMRRSTPYAADRPDSSGPNIAHLLGQVFALFQDDESTTWASGDELLAFLEQGRALLSGTSTPACLINIRGGEATLKTIARVQAAPYARQPRAMAEILRTGDERSLAILSGLIQVSQDTLTAGQLESGIGARLLLAVGPGRNGEALDFIEADSSQPVSLDGPVLSFPGYTIMRQGSLEPTGTFTPDPNETSLVCGAMVCRRATEGANRFDLIQGEKGVQFKRGVIIGTGQSLRFAPISGDLQLDGEGQICTISLGDQVIRGPSLSLNVFDFTMTTPGFLLEAQTAARTGPLEAR